MHDFFLLGESQEAIVEAHLILVAMVFDGFDDSEAFVEIELMREQLGEGQCEPLNTGYNTSVVQCILPFGPCLDRRIRTLLAVIDSSYKRQCFTSMQ